LTSGILATAVAVGCGLQAVSAQQVAQAGNAPPADFGTAPSGEVPILFNDRHVYAKPDRLKENRVLAALVRGKTILIPLRSMFEQMGATVSYDPSTRTADVSKPGSDVKVRVGDHNVVINGESRPLDVPPEIYKGAIVVPIRVISEGMGAYVQWVPEKKTVVVRYVAAPIPTPLTTPPPTPAPVAPATAAPTAPPTPAPTVYNEFSPGNTGQGASFDVRGAIEFNLGGLPWMVAGDYRQFSYPHTNGGGACNVPGADRGCVTTIGGLGQTSVAAFTAQDQDLEGTFALKVLDPRVYLGIAYVHRTNNYGYPPESGVGVALDKLPDLDRPFSVYENVSYYPQILGNYRFPVNGTTTAAGLSGQPVFLTYTYLKYQAGFDYKIGKSPIFLDAGYLGIHAGVKGYAPSNISENGPYAGLGVKF
jgi:hypothetical protein